MRIINIHEAKTHLSRLVDQAVQGDAFIIAKAGKPLVQVASLSNADDTKQARVGFLQGNFHTPDDFDTMEQPAIHALFHADNDNL